MKIAIGCDHGGIVLKDAVIEYLKSHNIEVEDYGTFSGESVDYPDYALLAANAVASGSADKGIVLCGTGIGISICANKVNGIRCALCHDEFTAEMTSRHNNANMLAMGGRVIDSGTAVKIVDKWLNSPFEGGRHSIRVEKMMAIEKAQKV